MKMHASGGSLWLARAPADCKSVGKRIKPAVALSANTHSYLRMIMLYV
jgi:hypothetical protein